MTTSLKRNRRIKHHPKAGNEAPISPRRVIVFEPSAVLKERINDSAPAALRE
jgi:integration host factor subunit alpha